MIKSIFIKILDYFQFWGLPLIAIIGFTSALIVVKAGGDPKPAVMPFSMPATSPFVSYVAGAGLVEAKNENISIATNISGVVDHVFVTVGQQVKKGDPLFKVDSRAQTALVESQKAALSVSKANQQTAQKDYDFISSISDKRAVSVEDSTKRLNNLLVSKAQAEQALKTLEQAETDLARLTVTAPSDGTILRVNIRAGEFASAQVNANPLMILGDTSSFWLRVDIDENDAWRINRDNSQAVASLRGNSKLKTELKFVRFEPYVVPKKSLTGDNSERVDTRVLQVMYEFSAKDFPVFVGQLMDVYIDAKPHE